MSSKIGNYLCLDLLAKKAQKLLSASEDYLVEARARWPFLTHFDASNIKNDRQLVTMVKERLLQSQGNAKSDVRQLMEGKAF